MRVNLSALLLTIFFSTGVFGQSISSELETFLIGLPPNCEQGQCIDNLIDKYQGEQKLAELEGCLMTPDQFPSQTDVYLEKKWNETCLKRLNHLQKLGAQIEQVAAILESADNALFSSCQKLEASASPTISTEITAIVSSTQNMCTEDMVTERNRKCTSDIACATGSSMLSILPGANLLAEKIFSEDFADCNLRDDSCLTQVITGFVNTVWDFLSFILSPLKNAVVNSWNWLFGIEEETSNRQLALAQASQEDGILDQIIDDPIGSMKNMSSAMMEMLRQWLKTDAYCQEWSGIAHYSECTKPWEGLECTSCKAMINGTCHLAGAFLSEVVPAFLTGGLVNAIKYGVGAGHKLVKTLKVSDKVSELAKKAPLANQISEKLSRASLKTTAALEKSRSLQAARQFLTRKMVSLKEFMSSVGRLRDLNLLNAMSSKKAYVLIENGKRLVIFSGKAIAKMGKVIIYPIENPLTQKAFDMGMNLGRGVTSGGIRGALTSSKNLASLDEIDQAFIIYSDAEKKLTATAPELLEKRNQYLLNLRQSRKDLFDEALKSKEIDFSQLISELYPEVRYSSSLSKSLSAADIKKAEIEIQNLIKNIDNPQTKSDLQRQFNDHRALAERQSREIDRKVFFRQETVLANAGLGEKTRKAVAFERLGIDASELSVSSKMRLEQGLMDAHFVGADDGARVYEYTQTQLAQKYKILRDAGFDEIQANYLIRSGLAGGKKQAKIAGDDFLEELRRAARIQKDPKRADIFDKFLKNNRDEINKAVKAGEIQKENLNLENFVILKSRDSGREFMGVGIEGAGIQAFTLDNARLGLFKGRRAALNRLPKKDGRVFLADTGEAYRIADDGAIIKVTEGIPSNQKEIQRIMQNLFSQADTLSPEMAKQYRKFLEQYDLDIKNKLFEGTLTPKQISADNFLVATNPEDGLEYFLLGKIDTGDHDVIAFSLNGDSIGKLNKLYSESSILHLSDGTALQLNSNGHTQRLKVAHTETWIKDKGIFSTNQKGMTPIYREFIEKYQEPLKKEIMTHKLDPKNLKPSQVDYLIDGNGEKYYVIKDLQVEKSRLYPFDGSSPATTIEEIFEAGVQEARFGSGDSLRSFTIEGDTKIVSSSYRQNFADAIVKGLKFDASISSKDSKLFAQFREFINAKDRVVKEIIKESDVAYKFSPDDIFLTQIEGHEFYVAKSILGDDAVFIPKKPSAAPTGLRPKSYFTSDEMSMAQQEFKLQQLIGKSEPATLKISDENSAQWIISAPHTSTEEILRNSRLSLGLRLQRIEESLGRKITQEQAQAIDVILNGNSFRSASVFNYSTGDLKRVNRVLRDAGFSGKERRYLVESGLAARPPSSVVKTSQAFFSEDFSRIKQSQFEAMRDEIRLNLLSRSNSKSTGDSLAEAISGRSHGFTAEEAKTAADNIDALYFIDYEDYSHIALDMLDGNIEFHRTDIFSKYNEGYERPFENFQATMKWMSEDRPDISLDTFKQAHSTMMKGSIEDVSAGDFGKMRDLSVYGNVPPGYGIDDIAVKNMDDNIYTTWEGKRSKSGVNTGRIFYPELSVIKPEAINRLRKVDPKLADEITKFHRNQDLILDLKNKRSQLNDEWDAAREQVKLAQEKFDQLDVISNKNKSQLDEFEQSQKKLALVNKSFQEISERITRDRADISNQLQNIRKENDKIWARSESINEKLLEGLTQERINWFNTQRNKIGDIDSPEAMDDFVNLAAQFQRDLVSIHPFINGNGRTTRQFGLNYVFMREGIPPPRLLEPNNDLYRSLAEWQDDVRQGVLSSQNLMEDLVLRSRTGLPLQNSPDLVAPVDRSRVKLSMWRDGKKDNWIDAPKSEELNASQYREFLIRALEENPSLRDKIKKAPAEGWSAVNDRAMELYRENNIYYHYKKTGANKMERIERLRVGVPDQDFIHMYGRKTYNDLAQYQYKMDEFYTENTVWRGLAYRKGSSRARSDEEIVDLFREFNTQMSSNRAARQAPRNSEEIKQLALEDFEEYRKAVYGEASAEGDLVDVTNWHQHAEAPYYGNSIGYSTSARRKVGEDFALGAMQVGEYRKLPGDKVSEYLKPENQARIAQSLLIGEFASKTHHVDMMRLKKLRPDFSYGYGRQAETMGIGATDPDAVRIIQVVGLDDKGKRVVHKSFVRDPDNPALVHIVNGPAQEGVRPPAGSILKTVDMRQLE